MPMLVPAITLRNPKFNPVNHIEGVDDSKKIGSKTLEVMSTNIKVCVLKFIASQSKTSIITLSMRNGIPQMTDSR